MANESERDGGTPRNKPQNGAPPGGTQAGGNAQNEQSHQGQQERSAFGSDGGEDRSRGERFDEAQGGGRGADSTGSDADAFAEDQADHQERGQSLADSETDRA